jgi:cell division protein FtsL
MAAWTAIWDMFGEMAAERGEQAAPRRDADRFRLRPLPAEDVYLHIKEFDNTQVVRLEDPAARGTCWKAIGATVASAAMLIVLLLPSVFSLLAGYKLQQLDLERDELFKQKSALILERASLLTPQRLEEIARFQEMVDPAPQSVQYLAPGGNKPTVALNVSKPTKAVR